MSSVTRWQVVLGGSEREGPRALRAGGVGRAGPARAGRARVQVRGQHARQRGGRPRAAAGAGRPPDGRLRRRPTAPTPRRLDAHPPNALHEPRRLRGAPPPYFSFLSTLSSSSSSSCP